MKQLLLILSVFLLFSCRSVQKSVSKKQTVTDSTATASSIVTDVKKKDSTGKEKTVINSKTHSDSGYTKTTIVKEYFTDEFGFGSDNPTAYPGDTSNLKALSETGKAAKLKYRETTIMEKGNVIREAEQVTTTELKSKVQQSDSTGKIANSYIAVKKEETITDKNKNKSVLLPGWTWILLLFLLAAYCYYKKYTPATLWQILTKRTK